MHEFCLLGTDGKTKVAASSREVMHALLHFHVSDAVNSAHIIYGAEGWTLKKADENQQKCGSIVGCY